MEYRRMTIQLTESQHEAVKRQAFERGISMSEWIREAVDERLGRGSDAMELYNCYACDGDYADGYWLDVDGTDVFYCTECGGEQGYDDSPHARRHEA